MLLLMVILEARRQASARRHLLRRLVIATPMEGHLLLGLVLPSVVRWRTLLIPVRRELLLPGLLVVLVVVLLVEHKAAIV